MNQLWRKMASRNVGLLPQHRPYRVRGVRHDRWAALDDVMAGGSPISSSVARKVFQHFVKEVPGQPDGDFNLTPRDKECLDLLAKGKLYKEIADELSIRREMVGFHLHNIYKKLHVQTRTEAVMKYFRK